MAGEEAGRDKDGGSLKTCKDAGDHGRLQSCHLHPLLLFFLKHYNVAYVRWVEELLAESLTSYVKQKDENAYTRRTNKRCVDEG